NVAVREWREEIVFLHKIVPGGTDKAYGIHVARLAGIPRSVLERAREILAHLEEEHLHGRSAPPEARPEERCKPDETAPRQLDLFSAGHDELARRLAAIDPEGITPLEALNLLAELKKLLP
ncbi:MAG: DNA mismatch repair protein MutS, partial [Planctomycetota bacterium]